MPKILTKNNFSARDLKSLHNTLVIEINNHHTANNNDYDIGGFFDNSVKPYFQETLSIYNGSSTVDQAFTVIKEIRGEILNNILIFLDETAETNQLANINITIKNNIKHLIRSHKIMLQEMQYNCIWCAKLRELINQILGPITINNMNKLNANSLLGAWRALDPQNNRRTVNNGYNNNIFSYSTNGSLAICNSSLENSYYGTRIVEAIAVYYLATKLTCSGDMVLMQERENRFSIFIDTLTECLRAYDSSNFQGVDSPSCPPGILSRLVEQCGYEKNIQFISKKTFVNQIINKLVCKKVHELLKNSNSIKLVAALPVAFSPGFATNAKLIEIERSTTLIQQRYSLFDNMHNNHNNNLFFELIKEEVKKEKNVHANADPIIIKFYEEISQYDYNSFINKFLTLDTPDDFLTIQDFSRELQLVAYALSDPACWCHNQIVNMCLAKMKTLQPHCQQKVILGDVAEKISNQVIEEILLNILPQSLFADTFNKVNIAIIIESYKSGFNSQENNQEFINRIIKKFYYDLDELGKEEEVEGLDTIINELLIDRNDLIRKVALLILTKISKELELQQTSNLDDNHPEILINNNQYQLMEQQRLNQGLWQREILTSLRIQQAALAEAERQRMETLPHALQPVETRFAIACRRLR